MHDDHRLRSAETASRILRSPAQRYEAQRRRAQEAVEASFPAPAEATPDELTQMAIHALGFDGASLGAALGIARADGEMLIRSPAKLTRRQRALLAQYLEMRGDARAAARHRAIAARLREHIAKADDASPALDSRLVAR